MTPRRAPIVSLICVALVGCADSGPATVRLYGMDPVTKVYSVRDERLSDLADLVQMRGESVEFIGGATIVTDVVAAASDPKGNRLIRAEGGGPVSCSFVERDGVAHANDHGSLDMASSYFALWKSRELFVELGVDPTGLNTIRAYYHPRIELGTKLVPTFFALTDNAAYAPAFDGFLIVPHVAIPGTPFTTNQGVMTHEYSHKVFNRLVDRGSPVQSWLKHDWTRSATRQIRGVDEGFADLFGHLATLDSDYIRASLGGEDFGIDRDLADERIITQEYAELLLNESVDSVAESYDPHELGALVGSALWQVGYDLGDHRAVAVAVIEVERELGEQIALMPRYDFSTVAVLGKIAARFDGAARTTACAVFKQRFAALIALDERHAMVPCP